MTDINKFSWHKDATHIQINHGEWNGIVDTLQELGYREVLSSLKTTKRAFPLGCYKFDDSGRDKDLYVRTWDEELVHYYTMDDDDKNDPSHVGGGAAFTHINTRFKQKNKLTLQAAFGIWKPCGDRYYDKEAGDYVLPYALQQNNRALAAMIDCDYLCRHLLLTGVYKADISSAYPYQLTKPLPTTQKMIGPITGRVSPFPGYVAFWTKSGHVIAEDVDTRKLMQHPAYENRHKFLDVPEEEEISYLLPLSNYTLAPIMEELYEGRTANPKNKGIMNSFVGMLRSRKEYQTHYMGHISALVYARHIAYMCELYDKLKADGCYPIMYATDSIMWLGGPSRATVREKYLGSFTLEYENCRATYTSCGNYAIEDPQTKALALVKHQGIAKGIWKEQRIETLEDFRERSVIHLSERYNKKIHKFELYEKVEIKT